MAEQQAANLAQKAFQQPADPSTKVWRYMDLPKLISLLADRTLYFSRLDLLRDTHEGSTPKRMVETRDAVMRQVGAGQHINSASDSRKEWRTTAFVSCWHLGNHESEAMWRLYCPGDQ